LKDHRHPLFRNGNENTEGWAAGQRLKARFKMWRLRYG
jgi:hypothetical protein